MRSSSFRGALRWLTPVVAAALVHWPAARAEACGCFTPPDPVTPIVQSGERILFAVSGGEVTATIQIQYSGAAADFGWLLPLPSVPTLEVSSDEVFNSLRQATDPTYEVDFHFPNGCGLAPTPGGSFDLAALSDMGLASGGGPNDPLVIQDSVGPYDYAVLKADDKSAMLAWLAANHYFVPAGTDSVVAPYIHAGSFFLALRLRTGQSTGDLQPVVVHYNSDLPMIPIVLTSVTAQPNMGIWVWLLGTSRAIPRNYHHVVLDDAALTWPVGNWYFSSSGVPSNYEDVVQRAVSEAGDHHAFMTEMAVPTQSIKSAMFPPGRFGNLSDLQKITDAGLYLDYLKSHGYLFSSTLVTTLQKYIKQPANMTDVHGNPVSPANYYFNFDYWKSASPLYFVGFDLSYDPVMLTMEIDTKIVTPVRAAAAQFDLSPYLTRMHTRLSPADMTADPVFSFNPDLPDVSNHHLAIMDVSCANNYATGGVLTTEDGFAIDYSNFTAPNPYPSVPGALRVETLREAGPPMIETDNQALITGALGGKIPVGSDGGGPVNDLGGDNSSLFHDGCQCNLGHGRRGSGGLPLLLVVAAIVALRRRARAARILG